MDVLINKLMYMVLFLSILNTIRHGFFFFLKVAYQEKYVISNRSLLLLGLSLSFILMVIFSGVTI